MTGDHYVGGIVGLCDGGTIANCVSAAAVTGRESAGGIVGALSSARVTGCTAAGTVTGTENCGGVAGECREETSVEDCRSLGSVTGRLCVGGVAGKVMIGEISRCWNTGTVTGDYEVGGIAGLITEKAALRNCYDGGTVSGTDYVGSVTGDGWSSVSGEDLTVENCCSYTPGLPPAGKEYGGTVTGCYVRSDTESGPGLLTTAQFASPASFGGWDFETVWSLDNGVRPILRDNPEAVQPAPKSGGGGGGAAPASNPITVPAAAASVSAHGTVKASAANAKAGTRWSSPPNRRKGISSPASP